MWKCSSCGVVNSKGLVCHYCQEPAPAEATAPPPIAEWSTGQWFQFLSWVIGGVFCIGIGIWVMFDPKMRADPRVVTPSDLLPGFLAVLVGVVMPVLSYLIIRRRK